MRAKIITNLLCMFCVAQISGCTGFIHNTVIDLYVQNQNAYFVVESEKGYTPVFSLKIHGGADPRMTGVRYYMYEFEEGEGLSQFNKKIELVYSRAEDEMEILNTHKDVEVVNGNLKSSEIKWLSRLQFVNTNKFVAKLNDKIYVFEEEYFKELCRPKIKVECLSLNRYRTMLYVDGRIVNLVNNKVKQDLSNRRKFVEFIKSLEENNTNIYNSRIQLTLSINGNYLFAYKNRAVKSNLDDILVTVYDIESDRVFGILCDGILKEICLTGSGINIVDVDFANDEFVVWIAGKGLLMGSEIYFLTSKKHVEVPKEVNEAGDSRQRFWDIKNERVYFLERFSGTWSNQPKLYKFDYASGSGTAKKVLDAPIH